MTETCVKIVDSGNVSFVAFGHSRVRYDTDQPVEAPKWLAEMGHHLTVFDSVDDAVRFIEEEIRSTNIEDAILWWCECEDEVTLPNRLDVIPLANKRVCFLDGYKWPKGTRMFKKVKLTKRVPKEEYA